LSRVVAVVVGAQAVAVALVVSEREQVCPLRLEPLTL
jgi:hypothetical protein